MWHSTVFRFEPAWWQTSTFFFLLQFLYLTDLFSQQWFRDLLKGVFFFVFLFLFLFLFVCLFVFFLLGGVGDLPGIVSVSLIQLCLFRTIFKLNLRLFLYCKTVLFVYPALRHFKNIKSSSLDYKKAWNCHYLPCQFLSISHKI